MSDFEIGKYRQFFDVDEQYFPCIDDSAIEAGAPWDNTYPHETFIELLNNVENMLGGSTRRSIWIHGAYGTGKSQCAYALKKILDVPENELIDYWNRFEPLKENTDLLQKLLGHKERKIVTAYRYASGGITSPRDLFFAIQESLKKSIEDDSRIEYKGENSIKESVIAWLEDSLHKNFFDELLKKPEWNSVFSQSTTDEVLDTLKKSENVKSLIDNIFLLADKEGITAMSLDADKLKAWIKDIIRKNDIKIVFVWDEFSGFFRQNRNSLDEFQKIVALCQEIPFYFIVVTHQTDSIINDGDSLWSVVRQRFNFSQITLPDNIAFDLIGHAFNVKKAAKETWDVCASDLNSRLTDSRREVMKAAKITNPKVIKDIMPLHPMTALVLKNIASAFQSNQRSMFDFIKTSNKDNVKAFQWFIENTGPADDHPLLTIDMLWNFFYERDREGLAPDIRMILDTYQQQQNLREDEQRVLKTILIMQAIDKRLGGTIDLLKPTEQNLSYAFEGISSGLDIKCKNLAKGLNQRGILVLNPIGNNKFAYGVAVLAGDQAKIDEYKKNVKNNSTTAKLVSEGNLATALSLNTALKLRFAQDITEGAMIPVTLSDFTRTMNGLKDINSPWHFNAVLAFAKDEAEAASFRKLIKESAVKDEYKNIIIIDALGTPLGEDDFNAYVDFAAMTQYYQGNNNNSARENANKAQLVLSTTWKTKIYNGSFYVYYDECREGERVLGGQGVASVLQTIVLKKYPYVFDFSRGLTENQLKLTQAKFAAKCGLIKKTSGVVINAEKSVLSQVWDVDDYWNNPATSTSNISVIKKEIDSLIEDSFKAEGQVAIGDIYDVLETKFGFAPSNLSAFILGFLLREYSGEPYRYSDSSGSHEPMSIDKMAEMISNHISKKNNPTYILKMTPEEKAFYELIEVAWGIEANSCSSAGKASILIKNKMQSLGLPVWCLSEVDDYGVYNIINMFIDLVQKEGAEAHKISIIIGEAYLNKPSIGELLKNMFNQEKCKIGMLSFLNHFEEGKVVDLAKKIGAEDRIISDISDLFSVQNSSLWNMSTGKEQIKLLMNEYKFVSLSNQLLNLKDNSKKASFNSWRELLSFSMCSCEALKDKYLNLSNVFDFLLKIFNNEEILSDQMAECTVELEIHSSELKGYFNNEVECFKELYSPYLEDIADSELNKLKTNDLIGVFGKTKTESNAIVKRVADEYRKNQAKTKMFSIWKEKTRTKNPIDWSEKNRTPIMLMVDSVEYDEAKKAFDILNRNYSTDKEIKETLAYLEKTQIFDSLNDRECIDNAFKKMLKEYCVVLKDIEKVRDFLEKLAINSYEWDTHPAVSEKIKDLARAEYESGESDRVVQMIEKMDEKKMKEYLIHLSRKNMRFGIEILNEEE